MRRVLIVQAYLVALAVSPVQAVLSPSDGPSMVNLGLSDREPLEGTSPSSWASSRSLPAGVAPPCPYERLSAALQVSEVALGLGNNRTSEDSSLLEVVDAARKQATAEFEVRARDVAGYEDGDEMIEILVVRWGEDDGGFPGLVFATLALNSDGFVWLVPFALDRRRGLVIGERRTENAFMFVVSKTLCAVAAGAFLHLGYISEEVAPGVPVVTVMRLLSSFLLSFVAFGLFCEWSFRTAGLARGLPLKAKASIASGMASATSVHTSAASGEQETSPGKDPAVRKVMSNPPQGWEYRRDEEDEAPSPAADDAKNHDGEPEAKEEAPSPAADDAKNHDSESEDRLSEKSPSGGALAEDHDATAAEEPSMLCFVLLAVINAIPDTAALLAVMLGTAYTYPQLIVGMLVGSTVAATFCCAAGGMEGVNQFAQPLPLWFFTGLLAGGCWLHIAFDD